jgi:hypothetical protein
MVGTIAGAWVALIAASAQEAPPAVAAPEHAPDDCCVRRSRARAPDAPLPADRKSRLLRELAAKLKASDALFYGEAPLAAARARLAALPADAPTADAFDVRWPLADALLSAGDLDGAREQLDHCLRLAIAAGDAEVVATVTRQLAVAWLRTGERENCVAGHHAESCIVPFSSAAHHTARRGSEQAIALLEPLLKERGDDVVAQWLLNVAHMTLGSWPDGVAEAWRVPPERFASEAPFPKFRDAAGEVGLATIGLAGGAVMDDMDGDGRLDIVVTSSGMEEPIGYFLQDAEGRFHDRCDAAGLAGQVGGFQCFARDLDNDGRLDLLVQRGAWTHRHGEIPNSLLMQQKDGTFVDRTLEAGLEVAAPSLVAAFADIDLDGDLDVFLGGESRGKGSDEDYPCRLFRNEGSANFVEITAKAGVRNDRVCKGAAFGDFDGDRFPDLYVSNLGAENRLYRNRGDGTFVDVAAAMGVCEPITSFSCAWLDANNDGWLDLWVANYATPRARPAEMAAWMRHATPGLDTMRLYENDGKGRLVDVTAARGLARVVFPMGSNVGDLDGDGFDDLYLATGDPEFASLWPNALFKNDRGHRFLDVTTASGTGHLQKGHGVAIGDVDGDGDNDLFVEIGGVLKDDAFASALFRNPGAGAHWLTVRLVGRESNRFGIGARVRATIEEAGATRDVFHFVGTNSSFGGNSLQAELGLGAATRIVALEVAWPRTGKTQRFEGVALDQVVVVDEGSAKLATVQR